MAPEAETSTLPRWDLSRFGFDSPFSDGIDSHLAETRKLAENFKAKYEGKLVSGWSLLHPVYLLLIIYGFCCTRRSSTLRTD